MSLKDNSRYITINNSSIPIFRRIHHLNKKQQALSPLPEISKYIETIITSNGGYHEINGVTYKRMPSKKSLKDRGKSESKTEEKLKNKLIEATKTCEKRSKVSNEDVRFGTKRRKTEKLELDNEIKILKKLYPNPYELEKVDEFKILKSIKESKEKLQDSASVRSESGEEKSKRNSGSLTMSKLPALIKSMTEHRSSSTTISTVRESSLKENGEEKNFKSKVVKSKIYVIGSTHLRQASAHMNTENVKVSSSKKEDLNKSKTKSQELVRHSGQDSVKANPRVLSRIYEYKQLQHLEDLQQIYEIMNKVTESYLKITSKVIDIKYASLLNKSSATEMITVNRSIKQKENTKVSFVKENPTMVDEEHKTSETNESSEEIDTTIVRSQIVLLEPKIEERSFFDDADFMKTTQKIDEVLEFMYKFIQNFSTKELTTRGKKKQLGKDKGSKPPLSLPLKSKTPKVTTREDKHQEEVCQIRSFTHIGRSSKSCSAESSKTNSRPRGRRRQGTSNHSIRSVAGVSTPAQQVPRLESILSPSSSMNIYPGIRCESSELVIDNEFQTVEGQNELGGCNEDVHLSNEVRLPKPVTPLSVKPKKSNAYSCKVIKSALEIEEKLMANLAPKNSDKNDSSSSSSSSSSRTEVKPLVPNESLVDLFVPKTQARTFSIFNLKPRSSNFVLCVNSLPPYVKSNIRKKVPRTYLSVILNDSCFEKFEPFPVTLESLQNITLVFDGRTQARQHEHVLQQQSLAELFVTKTMYLSIVVSFLEVSDVSRTESSCFLKNSSSPVVIEIATLKTIHPEPLKALKIDVEKSLPVVLEVIENVNADSQISDSNPNLTKTDKQAEEINVIVKEAEDIIVIEKNRSDVKFDSNSDKSEKTSECSLGKDTDTKKIYDLLLRTQSLQSKLRHYLNKMSSAHPVSLPSFLLNESEKFQKQDTKDSQNSTSSLIKWCEQSLNNSAPSETTHNVSSQHPPEVPIVEKTLDEILKDQAEEQAETKEMASADKIEEDKDDRSSVCSFKSSVGCSETNETAEETKNPLKTKNEFKSMTMFKKFFNDVDVFKSQIMKVNKENNLNKEEKEEKSAENESKELEVAQSSPTSDPKALKTIFKGKESVTELSIGFKGVNKINNISVEKKKYSPNHTKLSICIFKENGRLLTDSCKSEESTYAITNSVRDKEISTYYLDSFRPSISSSLTECSRMEELSNRSFDARKSDSDDDEDDFKSVASTLSDTELSKMKSQKKEDYSKKFTRSGARRKHRFEFYQKMEPRLEEAMFKTRYKAGPYKLSGCKELEPVQQALTELQMRMRSIKKDSLFSSTRYYKKALKLAKMSAGYCQTCGNRSVIPDDTFGLYRTILPKRHSNQRNCCYLKATSSPNTSYYSFCAGQQAMRERYCDLSLKQSSSYLHKANHSALGNSFHEVPVYWERI